MNAAEIACRRGGHRAGRGWLIRCPVPTHGQGRGDRTPSCLISDGERGLLVWCYAGCAPAEIYAALRGAGELPAHERRSQHRAPTAAPAPRAVDPSPVARAIWRAARPASGSAVELYLRRRGIRLPIPPTLRHARLRHRPSGRRLDAMVAAVQASTGAVVAIHRTYLASDGAKAPVTPVRLMLGPCSGGAVRLACIGPEILVGEGIESVLAAMQPTGLPGWAALSTSGLRALVLPDVVRTVIIAADGDAPGAAAAEAAARRWEAEGRAVRIARPPANCDFNDVLVGRADAAGAGQ